MNWLYIRLLVAVVLTVLVMASPVAADTASSKTYEGIPAGYTEDGAPYLGSTDAPVVLEEWSDYLCPFCGRHFRSTVPQLLEAYVRSGKLRLVFRDFPLAGLHPTAARGHVAARCAGAAGADGYWAMHDALFSRQLEWNHLPDPDPYLKTQAAALGLDAGSFDRCMRDDKVAAEVAASVSRAQGHGFNSTPNFRFIVTDRDKDYEVSGAHPFDHFAQIANALLAGQEPPEESKPEPPELPFWAKPEGFSADPARPGYNLAGDAYKGNPQATVVVIEFSDFQCPACARHVREVQPAIDAALVEPGKVLWISKHLPLRIHPQAPLAAAAAECAGDQQRYWEMHDALFEEIERWAHDSVEEALMAIAAGVGLDMPVFRSCLDGRVAMERVLRDVYDAQNVVRTTPSFVVVKDGRGQLLQPLLAPQFIRYLEDQLRPGS